MIVLEFSKNLSEDVNTLVEDNKLEQALEFIVNNKGSIDSIISSLVPTSAKKRLLLERRLIVGLNEEWETLIRRRYSAEINHRHEKLNEFKRYLYPKLFKEELSLRQTTSLTPKKLLRILEKKYDRTFSSRIEFEQMQDVFIQTINIDSLITNTFSLLEEKYIFEDEQNPAYKLWFEKEIVTPQILQLLNSINLMFSYVTSPKETAEVESKKHTRPEHPQGICSIKKEYALFKAIELEVVSLKRTIYARLRPNEIKLLNIGIEHHDILRYLDNHTLTPVNVNEHLTSQLTNAYKNRSPELIEELSTLITNIKSSWTMSAHEYNNILLDYFDFSSETEASFARIIEKIKYGKQCDLIKSFPALIRELVEDQIISKNDLSPNIADAYPLEAIHAKYSDSQIFSNEIKFEVKKLLRARMNDIIASNNTNATTPNPSSALRVIQQSLILNKTKDLNTLIQDSVNDEYLARAPNVQIYEYAIAFDCDPDTFGKIHLEYINSSLELRMPSSILMHKLLGSHSNIKGPHYGDGMNNRITYTLDYSTDLVWYIFKLSNSWGNHDEKGNAVFIAKKILEQYCNENKITFYTEHSFYEQSKSVIVDKINSINYEDAHKDRIASELTEDRLLDIIDFFAQNMPCRVKIDETQGKYPSGTLIYDKSGYIPSDDLIQFPVSKFNVDITQLFILSNDPNNYRQRLNELRNIDYILDATKNWKRQTLPEEQTALYLDFLRHAKNNEDAGRASWEYWEYSHGGVTLDKKRAKKDPEYAKAARAELAFEEQLNQNEHNTGQTLETLAKKIIALSNLDPSHTQYSLRDEYARFLSSLKPSLLVQNQIAPTTQTNQIAQTHRELYPAKTKNDKLLENPPTVD
ncbi:MAG: hypothetical protein ACP5N2_00080 [Candidatus Nanoarchaeia archaeon]